MRIAIPSRGRWLRILGGLLIVFSLIRLYPASDLLQYAALVPTGEKEATAFFESGDAARAALTDVLSQSALSAIRYGAYLSCDDASETVTLTAVQLGWRDLYPIYLLDGRWMDEAELTVGARVIVLDEPVARKLFPSTDPLEGYVSLDGQTYRVIGVARYRRDLGDSEAYRAYLPLKQASADSMSLDVAVLTGSPIPRSGATTFFSSAVRAQWTTPGTYLDLSKETSRAAMPLRIFVILAGIYCVVRMAIAACLWLGAQIAYWRGELRTRYLTNLLREMGLCIGLFLLIAGALAALGYGVLYLAVDPMYVFPEWVPDVIVEWSSITERFWGLVTTAAAPIRVQTREYAQIRFFAVLLRWGLISLLMGAVFGHLFHKMPQLPLFKRAKECYNQDEMCVEKMGAKLRDRKTAR